MTKHKHKSPKARKTRKGKRRVYGCIMSMEEIRENPQPGAVCLQSLQASWKSEPLFMHLRKIEDVLGDRCPDSELAAVVIEHPDERDPLVYVRGSVFNELIRCWRTVHGFKA